MQATLFDSTLGELELGCYPYVVTSIQIGTPQVRVVSRNRALADGAYDDTKFTGSRAVTVTVRLNNRGANGHGECDGVVDMQTLIDQVVPYMTPRRRPTLSYLLPGATSVRSMVLRGADWPIAVNNAKYPTLPLQWVCPTGEIFSGDADDQICEVISPASDTELGRTYDLVFDRVYPPSPPVGGRIITNIGNAPAHWVITIFGPVTNPFVTINGRQLIFDRLGGVVVNTGQNITIDSRARTVLFNADPLQSKYAQTNFDEWTWDQMRLQPGENTIVFGGTALGVAASMQICYRPTWLA